MSVQEIAIAPTVPADLFATVEGDEASVWSSAEQKLLARFPVQWDIGGRRLAIVSQEPVRIFTAAYHVHGVSAYLLDGTLVWRRKDLKKVHYVTSFRDVDGREVLALGGEARPATIVHASDGETRARLRDTGELFVGAGGVRLEATHGSVRLRRSGANRAQRIALRSFGVLDAAFSDQHVTLAEAAGNLRCFTLSGVPVWEYEFQKGTTHALEVAWNRKHRLWLAVVWNYQQGGSHWLYRLDEQGKKVGQADLGPCAHRLSRAGDLLVLDDGRVLDPIRDTGLWRYRS